jgi:hypothetical protein
MVNTDQYVQELDWINEPSTCTSKILNTFFLYHKLKNYIVLEFGKYEQLQPSRQNLFLIYADNVNMLGESLHTIMENVEALVAASKEIRLEVNADKTKYTIMYQNQTAG